MATNIKQERNELLQQIRILPPLKAQEKLHYLRKHYDWEIPGYRNSLNILSDTAYQDRKHFLLELIQNADDAQYSENEPRIRFIIEKSGITILYNEDGFSVEDLIAITDTGSSTKIKANRFDHGFIGEKGIGFKSVFALASSVEIDSPPWHFVLNKDECIVPYPLNGSSLTQEGKGTRLKITFTESESISIIADELLRIVGGEVESFLFLQQLTEIVVEDHREDPAIIYSQNVRSGDRGSNQIEILSSQNKRARKYYLYSKDVEFPRELVRKRWDNVDIKGKSLKRKVIAAFPLPIGQEKLPEGRLFCYLPTLVTLPIPLFLQVDGQTTADREKLHDPQQNAWNKHLLSTLPKILVDAIIALKKIPITAERLLDYLPTNSGDQQLAPQFAQLIDLLKEESWVRTFSKGKDQWVKPENAIIPSRIVESLISVEPQFRYRAEKHLNKKFVHPDWLTKSEWKAKLLSYGVSRMDEETFISLVSSIPISDRWLKDTENLISLYSNIEECPCIKNRNGYSYKSKFQQYRTILLHAPIFPLPKKGFGPLISQNPDGKIFWVSSRSTRETGLENSIDYTIVSTEYTYHPKSSGDTNQDEQSFEQKVRRNSAVRDLLKVLEVPELSDENILRELQIPYLAQTPLTKNTEEIRYEVLYSIFQKYRGKRTKGESKYDEFIETLSELSDVVFPSTSGDPVKLCDLILPRILRLYPEDHLFEDVGLPTLHFPKKYWTPPNAKVDDDSNRKDAERTRKWREEWRKFLILCNIRNEPSFKLSKIRYNNVSDYSDRDPLRFKKWAGSINYEYTFSNAVDIESISLDPLTQEIIQNESNDVSKFARPLYQSWLKNKNGFDLGFDNIQNKKLTIGNYYVRYVRHALREKFLQDITWGGILRDLIPLEDINGKVIRSKECIAVHSSHAAVLKKAKKYLHFVQVSTDTQRDDGYHQEYLDSLQVSSPSIYQVNALWGIVDSGQYDDILEIAQEYHAIGVDISQLKIYDRISKRLRLANDFCLGFKAPDDTPLIEVQYGKIGREIGEIIGLSEGSSPDIYSGFFEMILHSRRISKKNTKILQNLLKKYPSWNPLDQKRILDDFNTSMKKCHKTQAAVVFNDNTTYQRLYDSKIWVSLLEAGEEDLFNMHEAARAIGFALPEDIGKLTREGETTLTDKEREQLATIFDLYKTNLLPRTRSKLQGKLRSLGIFDIKTAPIFRVKTIYQTIGPENNRLPTILPHFDQHSKVMYVDQNMGTSEILGHILEIADYGNCEDLIPRIKDIEDQYQKSSKDAWNVNTKTDQISKIYETDIESIRNTINNSLKCDRKPDLLEDTMSEWKHGQDPFDEIRLCANIRNKVKNNIAQGPEHYNKNVRHQIQRSRNKSIDYGGRIADPHSIDPKSFFFSEYQERCQVCGLQIKLRTGRFYSVTYHIQENRDGETWWNDQPFNILCMCPNCHAIAKEGGCDMRAIFDTAEEYEKGNLFPVEVPEFHGEYYLTEIEMNGERRRLVLSTLHLIYFAALVSKKTETD